jgi:outer membrane immunogenic protein
MKRAVIGGLLCVVGLAGPAVAADLRAKGPAIAAAPAWSWSGGYIGLHGGYAWGDADDTTHPWNGAFAPASTAFSQDVSGGVFGFQTGFNWQVGSFVFGLEGTTAWTGAEGKEAALFAALPNATYKTEIENLSTFTPRLGITNGPWLLYGRGGVAYGEVKSTLTDAGGQYFRETNDHIGWTAGVGLEYALTPNWILGVEYNYVDLGDQRYGGAPTFVDYKADITLSTVLARLSYKFGAGGNPITAAVLGPETPNGLWNGFYLGLHGGYAWGTSDQTILAGPALVAGSSFDYDASGGVFGGQIGYLTQIGNWVIGTEATISSANLKETETVPAAALGLVPNATSTTELDWLATTTLRVGYSWGPWQVYGKGGTAFGEVESKYVFGGGAGTFTEKNDHVGWTIGAGLEYAWGNWLVGVEYNYYDLGDEKYGGFTDVAGVQTFYKDDVTFSSVLARLSYKFAEPTSVVAKY